MQCLESIAAERALTDEESARLSYLVKYYSRSDEQRERVNARKRECHTKRRDEINAAKRERYANDWLYAEKRRFENRVDYRKRRLANEASAHQGQAGNATAE